MARVVLFAKTGTPRFVVDYPGGKGCPNIRQDVLLVQFFLKAISVDAGSEKAYVPPGEQPIKVDGVCGAHTIAYIKFFQEENMRRNPAATIHVDGRVDPLLTGTSVSSITHSTYTIIRLNATYKTRFGTFFANPILDPLFPRDLVRSLYLL